MEAWKNNLRPYRNHDFIVVERMRSNEMKRYFVVWNFLKEEPTFTQHIMELSSYGSIGVAESVVDALKKKFPTEEFKVRRLVIDFDIYDV